MPYLAAVYLLMLLFLSSPVFAWWDDEHQAVAKVAENNLSQQAHQQIRLLLKDKHLSDVANWADTIKRQPKWRHSKCWHYLNLNQDQVIEDYESIVGGDILWALDYFYRQLSRKEIAEEKRQEALMFFVHFVGDIHQPLHVGKVIDSGGNKVSVNWYQASRSSNLHKLWDGQLTQLDLSSEKYAKRLEMFELKEKVGWQNSTFRDWAKESSELHKQVYDFGGANLSQKNIKLGLTYQTANGPIAEKRIFQAGIRLAHYLNLAFE